MTMVSLTSSLKKGLDILTFENKRRYKLSKGSNRFPVQFSASQRRASLHQHHHGCQQMGHHHHYYTVILR